MHYGYILLCEGCVADHKIHLEHAEPQDLPWTPCSTSTISSYPMYDTEEEARSAGSLVASETYGREYARLWWWRLLRGLRLVRHSRLPDRREIRIFSA